MISLSLSRTRKTSRPSVDRYSSKRKLTHSSDITWIPAEENPWKVPVLDLAPQTYFATPKPQNFQVLEHFQRVARSNGVEFDECKLRPSKKVTECELTFPVEGTLAEGILFRPTKLDHKWGIYFRGDRIVCVNTWSPDQVTIAKAVVKNDELKITHIEGSFLPESKEANEQEPTDRILKYLLHSHTLNETFPAPILPPFTSKSDVVDIANSAFDCFGSFAEYATDQPVLTPALKPLRTISLAHLAARKGDVESLERLMKKGMSLALKDYYGCTPVYHAAFSPSFHEIVELVCNKQVPIDAPVTEDGATLLMVATETGDLSKVSRLVDKGANVNAKDTHGFTALHRAAEMGHLSLVQYFMKIGAVYSSVNNQHTPYSLATTQGQHQITSLLQGYGFNQ